MKTIFLPFVLITLIFCIQCESNSNDDNSKAEILNEIESHLGIVSDSKMSVIARLIKIEEIIDAENKAVFLYNANQADTILGDNPYEAVVFIVKSNPLISQSGFVLSGDSLIELKYNELYGYYNIEIREPKNGLNECVGFIVNNEMNDTMFFSNNYVVDK